MGPSWLSAPAKTVWRREPHTEGKHLVLRNYLGAWFPILGSRSGRIVFIDGFAGPGEYSNGEPGSPIIALETFLEHRARGSIKEAVFSFVEADPKRARHLEDLIQRRWPKLPENCKVDVSAGTFDGTMTAALDELDAAKKRLAPAFVMIDPFGVKETPMSVVRRILSNPRSEVYVSFMVEAINRFRATPEFERHLDDLFGCTDWRAGISLADGAARLSFFYELYERQLRRAGAKQVVRFDLFEGKRLVYAIFFGTQNVVGSDRMKQSIWKIAPFGDFAFHGVRAGRQLTLGMEKADLRPLREAIANKFRGKGWIRVGEVEEFVSSDATDFHKGQFKKGALKVMEDNGLVEVSRAPGKRKGTFPNGTKVRIVT